MWRVWRKCTEQNVLHEDFEIICAFQRRMAYAAEAHLHCSRGAQTEAASLVIVKNPLLDFFCSLEKNNSSKGRA